MKYAREVKVGVLAVVCAGILYFGFNFLKGVNIFSPTDCYYGQFERSNGLTEQAPVYILGHQVGLVESINYDFTRVPAFTVGVSINDDITLPIGTNMALVADGLLGGAAIELILPEDTGVAYKGGDTLTTTIVPGLMESLQAGVLANLDSLLAETNVLISNLTSEMEMGSLNATLRNIEQITSDLKVSGKDIRQFTHGQLPSIIARIDTTIAELQVIVTNVKDANVQNTVEDLNETIRLLNELLQSEDGTLGLLLNDTELHDNLNAALKNLDKAVLNVDSVVMSIKEQPFIKKRIPKN